MHQLNKIFLGAFIHLRSFDTRIDERFQTDLCNRTRTMSGNITEHQRNGTKGKVVAFYLVFKYQLLQFWN